MREIAIFIASLAGAAIMTALAVLLRPESPIWKMILWSGIAIFVACAFVVIIDYFKPGGPIILLAGMALGIALGVGCTIAFFGQTNDAKTAHNSSLNNEPAKYIPNIPRRLSSQGKRVIIEHLSQLKGTKIAAGALFGDDEAKAYRDDLVDALISAGWEFDGHVGEAEMQPPAFGVGVRVNAAEIQAGRVPAAAVALVGTLVDLHIMDRDSEGRLPFNIDPHVPVDRFWLFVGIRTRPK